MITILPLLLAATMLIAGPIDGVPLAALDRQALPASGCAAYLFTGGERRTLVAVATAAPATLRLAIDGKVVDVAAAATRGAGGYGLAAETDYRGAELSATLSLTIASRADLRDGAVVPAATLRIERPGKDGAAVALFGLIGCAPTR